MIAYNQVIYSNHIVWLCHYLTQKECNHESKSSEVIGRKIGDSFRRHQMRNHNKNICIKHGVSQAWYNTQRDNFLEGGKRALVQPSLINHNQAEKAKIEEFEKADGYIFPE